MIMVFPYVNFEVKQRIRVCYDNADIDKDLPSKINFVEDSNVVDASSLAFKFHCFDGSRRILCTPSPRWTEICCLGNFSQDFSRKNNGEFSDCF